MIETYTLQTPKIDLIKNSDPDNILLDIDDQLFYNFVRNEMDALLRNPQMSSVSKITMYSKNYRAPFA